MEYMSVEVSFPRAMRTPDRLVCEWRHRHLAVTQCEHELGWCEIYSGFDDRVCVDAFVSRVRIFLDEFHAACPGFGRPYGIRSLDGSNMNRVVREVSGVIGARQS